MKIKIVLIITIILSLVTTLATANNTKERMYLTQMINQLDSLKPLIVAASKEQDLTARTQFHYYGYRDSNGILHNGLFEDINEIKKGIQEKLSQNSIEPRNFQKIKGDYLNLSTVHVSPIHGEDVNNVK